jgi:hypothetical protein
MIASNRTYKFHADNTIPKGNWIWVFGSDESGKHRKGAAKVAHVSFGAKYGIGMGITGKAYAIPVSDKHLKALPFTQIELNINVFLDFAKKNPEPNFYIAHNGFDFDESHNTIANLFALVPSNCSLPEAWRPNVAAKFNIKSD